MAEVEINEMDNWNDDDTDYEPNNDYEDDNERKWLIIFNFRDFYFKDKDVDAFNEKYKLQNGLFDMIIFNHFINDKMIKYEYEDIYVNNITDDNTRFKYLSMQVMLYLHTYNKEYTELQQYYFNQEENNYVFK
jgi:hypothetical protein